MTNPPGAVEARRRKMWGPADAIAAKRKQRGDHRDVAEARHLEKERNDRPDAVAATLQKRGRRVDRPDAVVATLPKKGRRVDPPDAVAAKLLKRGKRVDPLDAVVARLPSKTRKTAKNVPAVIAVKVEVEGLAEKV